MLEFLSGPWPWYVAGPIIGLTVPALLLAGGKQLGISDNLRHLCAALLPSRTDFLRYDWKQGGGWNLTFMLGLVLGGFLAATLLRNPDSIALADATRADLSALGIRSFDAFVPVELLSWQALATLPGLICMVLGGFLVGFGTKYAGGCTSGHGVTGLADLQWPSLVAVLAFMAAGLFVTHFLLPFIL